VKFAGAKDILCFRAPVSLVLTIYMFYNAVKPRYRLQGRRNLSSCSEIRENHHSEIFSLRVA